MALKTRFIIIAPSDRPAPPGILGELQAIIPPIQAWIASQLNGPTFTPGTFTLINSQYTAAQFHMSPPFYADKTLDEASPGDSRKAENTSTIIIINSPATDYTGWGWSWSRTSGAVIIDELILIALAGEPPPPDAPPLAAQYWPNSLTGLLTHEMIHSWGVKEHSPGIMTEFWLYPNTFISEEAKAILLDSPFIGLDLPLFWIPLELTITCIPTGLRVYVKSDTLTTLQMVYSYTPPKSRRTYKIQRGERVFCYYTWKLIEPLVIDQEEPFNTHDHTFTLIPILGCQPLYFYIRHRFIAETKGSKTPIIGTHCALPSIWEEHWDKTLTGNHPWKCLPPSCPYPDQPKDGMMLLEGSYEAWGQNIRTNFEDAPWILDADPHHLAFSWAIPEKDKTHWMGTLNIIIDYRGDGDTFTTRPIHFVPLYEDCSYKDPLGYGPEQAGIRPAFSYGTWNLGILHDNPPDQCRPAVLLQNPRITELSCQAVGSTAGYAKMRIDYLRIHYQNPTPTPWRYEPTHPG